MGKKIGFEVCAYSLESCRTAEKCGVDRVELCASPEEGGVTPSSGMIEEARGILSGCRLFVMIRPRGGDFCYSDDEFEQMRRDVAEAMRLGADGVVLGLLNPDGSIDTARTSQLVREAAPMEVTFHRAFDRSDGLADFNASRPMRALEEVISSGCRRVLTSGFCKKAGDGVRQLSALTRQAAGRIEIMAGCGINAENAAKVAATGVDALHFSATSVRKGLMTYFNPDFADSSESDIRYADETKIRAILSGPEGFRI